MSHLANLTNDELLRYARSTEDSLTTTELEREFTKRFEALLNDSDEAEVQEDTLQKQTERVDYLEDVLREMTESAQNILRKAEEAQV